jgi:hypothetical protein
MVWWQTLIVVLSTLVITKTVDFVISIYAEKRNFKKMRRELALKEIEELKNEVGIIYELAANWMAYKEKEEAYRSKFFTDYQLVGKYNKYPSIAQAARDAVHWCKIVADDERKSGDDLMKNKKELGEKFKLFLIACEDYLEKLV